MHSHIPLDLWSELLLILMSAYLTLELSLLNCAPECRAREAQTTGQEECGNAWLSVWGEAALLGMRGTAERLTHWTCKAKALRLALQSYLHTGECAQSETE